MRSGRTLIANSAALLLLGAALPLVSAHGDGDGLDDHGTAVGPDVSGGAASLAVLSGGNATSAAALAPDALTYFRHPRHAGWMYAHVALLILAWTTVLPPAVMLSVARSRYHLPAQLLFHVLNGLGVVAGFVYNHATPDLYAGNSHHPIGWVVTAATVAWTVISVCVAYGEHHNKSGSAGRASHPMTAQAMARYDLLARYSDHAASASRPSRDSGHGTERNSASLLGSRQNSEDSIHRKLEGPAGDEEARHAYGDDDFDVDGDDDGEPEKRGFLGNNRVDRFVARQARRFSSLRAAKALRVTQIVLEKFLLLLGFLALATGFVVYGGVFKQRQVFSGLAHFIKGGIFFWYGLLTLGRWMGAFAEFGWAWNVRPEFPVVARWKSRIPSAEFTESFVICTYGASNVFLEHLNNWGQAWSPQDFEHVSITILFFGGGLLGMLIESSWARELMNTTVVLQKTREEEEGEGEEVASAAAAASRFHASSAAEDQQQRQQLWTAPKTYRTSLNPMPGLVIMLLGMMMSMHHQNSMVSTMMHAQWGGLFTAFALARAATYLLLFLRPPASHFPSRPPSELVAAFCLTAGGLMFMVSAHGTVDAIESNGFDAMTVFTVTMGLSAVILAWEVVCFAVKGWAIRKERAAAGHPVA